ncbi:MAG: TetR/AcrR family transcriptional regulator [Deltaproteobacteria bacterium]|nr:TetR/AcrR family transcriptional regulator [Deltaproteobacteria bacterium]
MTKCVKLVIMNNWTLHDFEKMFDEFSTVLPPDDPRAQKQRRILDAAAALFQKWGYRKTSMSDVAREAGVAKGTLYLYFKTKADLMVQVVGEEKRRSLIHMKPLFDEKDPKERIRKWVALGLQVASKMPITARLATGDMDMKDLMHELSDDDRKKSEAFSNAFLSALIDAASGRNHISGTERNERARVLRAIILYSLRMADTDICGDMTIQTFAETLSHILVNGAAGPPRMATAAKKEVSQ